MSRIRALGATVIALMTAGAANAAADPLPIGDAPSVSPAVMGSLIEGQLNGRVTGYQYAIAKNGGSIYTGRGGWARTPADGGTSMTPTTRTDIYSATKNFTAVAVLKLLAANNLDIDDPVSPWLPADWARGFGFSPSGIKFRHLLNHTSGLGQMGDAVAGTPAESSWNTKWDGVSYAVQRGVLRPPGNVLNPLLGTPWQPSPYNYTNMNYAVLRVAIAALFHAADPYAVKSWAHDDAWGSTFWVSKYVTDKLLAPAGITGAICSNATQPIFAYGTGQTSNGFGFPPELSGIDLQACYGHRGQHLSTTDMVKFATTVRYGTLLTPAQRNMMDSLELGWQPSSNQGAFTGMWWHGGDLVSQSGTGPELHTCIAKLPNGIEAAVIYNSPNPSGVSACGVIRGSFQTAAPA